MTIREIAHGMKQAAPYMAAASREQKDAALAAVREALLAAREEIFQANAADLAAAEENDVPAQVRKRLKFNEDKLRDVCAGLDQLMALADPVGKVLLRRQLDEGLVLEKKSCPIGVIGVIFEARPDALVQISGLCIKSGNCAVLKGGRETANTNRVLFDVICKAAVRAGLPEQCLALAHSHSEIDELLLCEGDVDLLIPRGSNRFVRYIMDHTKIPVMGHADGVCHIYADGTLPEEEALGIITDAKTQYPVACNAVETLLVKRSCAKAFLPVLKERMNSIGVRLRMTQEAMSLLAGDGYECDMEEAAGDQMAGMAGFTNGSKVSTAANGRLSADTARKQESFTACGGENEIIAEDDFHTEYGDLILAVKLVEDVREAVDHINRYGSHHTDCILTTDDADAAYFQQMVDSAGVYVNCSTRFADGFRYGFGAEVGISTGKLHARGPVGLDGLVTYKYLISGSGQIVGDYASGKRSFHFRDL